MRSLTYCKTHIYMYGLTGHWAAGKGDVTFDNFVQACVTVKTLTDSFKQYDTDCDGWIQIKYEDVGYTQQ